MDPLNDPIYKELAPKVFEDVKNRKNFDPFFTIMGDCKTFRPIRRKLSNGYTIILSILLFIVSRSVPLNGSALKLLQI